MKTVSLTIREIEVGICLATGMSAKEASKKLGISTCTVQGHQRKIKEKLKARNPYQVGWMLGRMQEIKN